MFSIDILEGFNWRCVYERVGFTTLTVYKQIIHVLLKVGCNKKNCTEKVFFNVQINPSH